MLFSSGRLEMKQFLVKMSLCHDYTNDFLKHILTVLKINSQRCIYFAIDIAIAVTIDSVNAFIA